MTSVKRSLKIKCCCNLLKKRKTINCQLYICPAIKIYKIYPNLLKNAIIFQNENMLTCLQILQCNKNQLHAKRDHRLEKLYQIKI